MKYQFSETDKEKIIKTLASIEKVITQLEVWNKEINSSNEYFYNDAGIQLLAANCTLFTAIGEGINRINRISDFLFIEFPEVPWKGFIGMRNQIAHGYFEIDAEIIYDTIQKDLPSLHQAIKNALKLEF
ncbi:MAG: DUF86 domain-containing protein [Muribaculaceae bacterium]|nr:DUF86 domain-containing protein [Muribaculaceae bacterium]